MTWSIITLGTWREMQIVTRFTSSEAMKSCAMTYVKPGSHTKWTDT